jgi:hypothetical protein
MELSHTLWTQCWMCFSWMIFIWVVQPPYPPMWLFFMGLSERQCLKKQSSHNHRTETRNFCNSVHHQWRNFSGSLWNFWCWVQMVMDTSSTHTENVFTWLSISPRLLNSKTTKCSDLSYCHVNGGTRDGNNGFWFGWLDLLAFQLQVLLITLITALSLIYTIYSSPLHKHWDSVSSSFHYKHSSYCCVSVSRGVYQAVAWQCVDISQYLVS